MTDEQVFTDLPPDDITRFYSMPLVDFVNEVAENALHNESKQVQNCTVIYNAEGLQSVSYRADKHTRRDIVNRLIELNTNVNLIKEREQL